MRNKPTFPGRTMKIRKGYYLLTIFLMSIPLFQPVLGQGMEPDSLKKVKIDSLREVLKNSFPKDTIHAWALYRMGKVWFHYNYDSSFYYLEKSLGVFTEMHHHHGMSQVMQKESELLHQKGEYQRVVELMNRNLDHSRSHGDLKGEATSFLYLGKAYTGMSRYETAQENLMNAFEIYEELKDSQMIGRSRNALANVQGYNENYASAREKYKQNLELFTQLKDTLYLAIAYNNVAHIHMETGQPREALPYLKKSLELERTLDESSGMVTQVYNLGECYLRIDSLDQAKDYFDEALQLAEKYKDPLGLITAYQGMGMYFNKVGKPQTARKYLNDALPLSEILESPHEQKIVLDNLIETEKLSGNYKKALEYTDQLHQIEDSLFSVEKNARIEELALKYEDGKKESELTVAREQEKQATQRSRTITWVSLIVGILLLGICGIFIYFTLRLRKFNVLLASKNKIIKLNNKELENVNEQLLELNEEKDVLMGIVAHDLKAPLAKAAGLTQVLTLSGDLNEEQQKVVGLMDQVFASGKKLIEELVLISKLESAEENLPLEDCDLADLVRETAESFRQTAARKSIVIEYVTQPGEIPFRTHKEYLGRVLDNLVSNAIKFSEARTKIQLIVESTGDLNRIAIRDQGPGIPEEEQPKLFGKFSRLSTRPTAGESSTGLGLYIVKELVEKLNGRIAVESEVGKGTEFVLEFAE